MTTKNDKTKEVKEQPTPNVGLGSILGDVVFMMTRSPYHRHLFVSDIEWLVMPPVKLKQMRVFRNEQMPLAYISWAFLDEEGEKRLLSGAGRLAPKDWNSGKNAWIVDNISAVPAGAQFLKALQEQVFKEEDVKIIRPKKDGKGLEGVLLKDFLKEVEKSQENKK